MKEADTCEETLSTREEHRVEEVMGNEARKDQPRYKIPGPSLSCNPGNRKELAGGRESEQEDPGWR